MWVALSFHHFYPFSPLFIQIDSNSKSSTRSFFHSFRFSCPLSSSSLFYFYFRLEIPHEFFMSFFPFQHNSTIKKKKSEWLQYKQILVDQTANKQTNWTSEKWMNGGHLNLFHCLRGPHLELLSDLVTFIRPFIHSFIRSFYGWVAREGKELWTILKMRKKCPSRWKNEISN